MSNRADPSPSVTADLERRALAVRRRVLEMVRALGHGYVGQGLGTADLFTTLYFHELRVDPQRLDDPNRDRLVLSVGHYAIGLFAVLGELGVYSRDELLTYGQDGSPVEQNATEFARGFEISGGSLGQGLSQAIGMALGARLGQRSFRVYALLSDGELQEGQVWEALQSAAHFRLDNLVGIFDINGLQADGPTASVMNVEPVDEKLRTFGWHAQRIDGNDIAALLEAFATARAVQGQPSAIVCDTVPGKGVPSLERSPKVHYVRPSDPANWDSYLRELEEASQAWP